MKAKYVDTFENTEGETVNRVVFDVPGHDVQVISYDNSPRVCVKVDHVIAMMEIGEIEPYITAMLGGGQ